MRFCGGDGYEREPEEFEIGRIPVATDRGRGFEVFEGAKLVATNHRLILLVSNMPPIMLLPPLAAFALFGLHPAFFPLLIVAVVVAWRRFKVRPTAIQRRKNLMAYVREPAPSVVLKPKLVMTFRDGTQWRLRNPNKGAGRLDGIVNLLQKGEISAPS